MSLALAVFLGACEKEVKTVSMPPTPASMVRPAIKDVHAYISTLGTTASFHSVQIVPQVSGQIIRLSFKQGDLLKKGDVIAVIDKRPYEAAVKQAEGNLLQSKAQLKIDQLEVERNRKLAKDDYVAKQTFDAYLAKVEVDKGIVEANEAILDDAKIKLAWCEVSSPIDGKVGFYNINAGNVVSAGTSLITTVERLDKLYVDFIIASQNLHSVLELMNSRGGSLNVRVSYLEGELAKKNFRDTEARIVLNKIRYETGTAILRGELDNKDNLFWPNQPVAVRVDLNEEKNAVLIPDKCIQTNDLGSYVYIAKPYKDGVFVVSMVQIEKGQLYDGNMRLVKGISPDAYVVEDVSQLRLNAGPYVYRANNRGIPYGADGKEISPSDIGGFIAKATEAANALRAEAMQRAKSVKTSSSANSQRAVSKEGVSADIAAGKVSGGASSKQ